MKRPATGDWLWRYLKVIGIVAVHIILVACSNNVSILHRSRDTPTRTVYVTVSDLEKSFSLDETVEITSHVRHPIHV